MTRKLATYRVLTIPVVKVDYFLPIVPVNKVEFVTYLVQLILLISFHLLNNSTVNRANG